MKKRGEKQDFSQAPQVGTSLADKLRSKGLVPAATPSPPPPRAPTAEPAVAAEDRTSAFSGNYITSGKPPKTIKRSPPDLDGGTVNPAGILAPCAKVVLRMERKGHGGKTVTVVDGVSTLGEVALTVLAKRLAKGLGCGARAEGGTVVLQGDHRDRAASLLASLGARRIIAG